MVMNEVRSSTETVNLYRYGDKELWYAQGEDWSLPVFVKWYEDKVNARHYAHIEPVFSLYTSQLLVLERLMEAHAVSGIEVGWLILKRTCEAILTKAPGVTPECYYKWTDCKLRPLPPLKPIQYTPEKPHVSPLDNCDQRDFINHVAKSSGIQSSVVRIVLDAIAAAAPDWMLEKRQAVDLGFCRILTAPFRANWKEIITFKIGGSKLRSLFVNHRNGELMNKLQDVGLPEVMASPHNIGLREKRIDYVLEVTPTPKFEKYVKAFSDRLVRLGKTSHVQHYEQMVESLYDELVESLRYYIKKVSTPFARVSECISTGVISLLPAVRSTFQSRRLPLANLPQRIIPTASSFSVFAESDKLEAVQKKAAALPEMPSVSQAQDDVRQCNLTANVECFPERDDTPGAARLHVLAPGEGANAGQPMLAGAETGTAAPGLDGKRNK